MISPSEFQLPNYILNLRYKTPTLNLNTCTTRHKILNCDNNNEFCLLVSDERMF